MPKDLEYPAAARPSAQVLHLKNKTCIYCGTSQVADSTTWEHVIGRRFVPKGTLNGRWNLIAQCCSPCNEKRRIWKMTFPPFCCSRMDSESGRSTIRSLRRKLSARANPTSLDGPICQRQPLETLCPHRNGCTKPPHLRASRASSIGFRAGGAACVVSRDRINVSHDVRHENVKGAIPERSILNIQPSPSIGLGQRDPAKVCAGDGSLGRGLRGAYRQRLFQSPHSSTPECRLPILRARMEHEPAHHRDVW